MIDSVYLKIDYNVGYANPNFWQPFSPKKSVAVQCAGSQDYPKLSTQKFMINKLLRVC